MAKTLREIMSWLQQMDEVSLLEMLNISSEEIVERFVDKIEEKADEYEQEMEDGEEE